jgi:hypothetical protein
MWRRMECVQKSMKLLVVIIVCCTIFRNASYIFFHLNQPSIIFNSSFKLNDKPLVPLIYTKQAYSPLSYVAHNSLSPSSWNLTFWWHSLLGVHVLVLMTKELCTSPSVYFLQTNFLALSLAQNLVTIMIVCENL